MSDRIGTLKRGGHSRGCHVDVAEDPKGPRQFRVIARKKGAQVGLYSRPGNDLTRRFPLIVETLARLRSRSCIIDGEAVACDENDVASFDLVRHQRANESIFLYAFDLIPAGNNAP
jgi:ATP-dependent DNA ligase